MEQDSPRIPRSLPLGYFFAYNSLAVPLFVSAFHLSRFTNEKARAGLEGRVGLWLRLRQKQDKLRGCVWFHASSVGEYEQARPIIRAFREEAARRGRDIPTLLTVFSPSGFGYACDHLDADHIEYLPLDTAPAAWKMIRMLEPRALVFVKFDCWPNMVWAARHRDVPLLLLDATFHRKSHRLRLGARNFFRSVFDCFHRIGAISEGDRTRFAKGLGVSCPIDITGDTRVDQVIHRWEKAENSPLVKTLSSQRFSYLALGSIWPADEKTILQPALSALEKDPSLGLIAVPHEPTPEHLQRVEKSIRDRGLEPVRLSELIELKSHQKRSTAAAKNPESWRVIVVDTVGVLAEIYRATILSYVGGSFTTGVHSVLEPAVTGQPVLFGPRIHNAYEAERLVELGAGFVVTDEESAQTTLQDLLEDPERLKRASKSAKDFVMQQKGATRANVDLILPLIFGKEDQPASSL